LEVGLRSGAEALIPVRLAHRPGRPNSKSQRRIFRRELYSCDDEDMPVMCPTRQIIWREKRLERLDDASPIHPN
jgi:hypothetical protein